MFWYYLLELWQTFVRLRCVFYDDSNVLFEVLIKEMCSGVTVRVVILAPAFACSIPTRTGCLKLQNLLRETPGSVISQTHIFASRSNKSEENNSFPIVNKTIIVAVAVIVSGHSNKRSSISTFNNRLSGSGFLCLCYIRFPNRGFWSYIGPLSVACLYILFSYINYNYYTK